MSVRYKAGGFVYLVAFTPEEAELAALELKALTGAELDGRLAFSPMACDLAPAAYARLGVEVLAVGQTIEQVTRRVRDLGLAADDFAVKVERVPPRPSLDSPRLAAELADAVEGRPDLRHPRVTFVLLAQEGRYIFGREVTRARRDWHDAGGQPANFSNALPPRYARALVNLVAVAGDTLVDPCCGAGTVLIEAARVGVRVQGLDMRASRVEMSLANLAFFGLKAPVKQADARELNGQFDAAVVDLPYGHTSQADDQLYLDIVGRVATCARRLAVVTGEDKAYLWRELGLQVYGLARVPAARLVRHVYLLAGGP